MSGSLQASDIEGTAIFDKQQLQKKPSRPSLEGRRINVQRKSSIADLLTRLTAPTTASKNRMRAVSENVSSGSHTVSRKISISQPISTPLSPQTEAHVFADQPAQIIGGGGRRAPPAPPAPATTDHSSTYRTRSSGSSASSHSDPFALKDPKSGVSRGIVLAKRPAAGNSPKSGQANRNSASSLLSTLANKKQDTSSTPDLNSGRRSSSDSAMLSPEKQRQYRASCIADISSTESHYSSVRISGTQLEERRNRRGSNATLDSRGSRVSSGTLSSILETRTEEDLSKPCEMLDVPTTPGSHMTYESSLQATERYGELLALQDEVKELQETMKKTTSANSALQTENTSLKEQLQQQKVQNDINSALISDLYTQLEKARRSVRSLESNLQEYKVTVEEKNIENYELSRKLNKVQAQLDLSPTKDEPSTPPTSDQESMQSWKSVPTKF